MSTDSEDELFACIASPAEKNNRKTIALNELPLRSRERYEVAYKKCIEWCLKNNREVSSESSLIDYFQELSSKLNPNSLWSIFSMIRTTLKLHDGIDLSAFPKLLDFLRLKSKGFKSVRFRALTSQQVHDFLQNAPDDRYLFGKVLLIIGIIGRCKKHELRNLKPADVEDTGKCLIITVHDPFAKSQRSFVVSDSFYDTCIKYMKLRPQGEDPKDLPFFIQYRDGKCYRKCVGYNAIGRVPSEIAKFLQLPHPEEYTGHCFRNSKLLIQSDSGFVTLERDGNRRPSNKSSCIAAPANSFDCEQPGSVQNRSVSLPSSNGTEDPCIEFQNCTGCTVTINNYYNNFNN